MKKIQIKIRFEGGQIKLEYPRMNEVDIYKPSQGLVVAATMALANGEESITGVIPSGFGLADLMDPQNFNVTAQVTTLEEAVASLKAEGIV